MARKKYLINSAFQLRVIGYLGGISFASILILCALFLWQQKKIHQTLLGSALPPTSVSFGLVALNNSFFWQVILLVAATFIIFVGVGIWITHKISGPMYRLKVSLREYLDGKLSGPIKFRKHDEFQDVLDLINQVIQKKTKE